MTGEVSLSELIPQGAGPSVFTGVIFLESGHNCTCCNICMDAVTGINKKIHPILTPLWRLMISGLTLQMLRFEIEIIHD
jgi:hypothetical protein